MTAPPRVISPRTPGPTHGPRIARLSAGLGRPFMPWQHLTADLVAELDPVTGRRRHGMTVLTVQRQAGKTTLILAAAVERCLFGAPGQRVWYTAQTGQHARDKWAEMAAELCAATSPLSGYVAAKWTNGSEALTFPNGSTFRPFPPTKDALHSKQSDLVIVDEAWRFDEVRGAELLQAISPTQATRPGAQTVLLSTMGTVAGSRWFHSWVDRGRGGDPTVTYIEYGIGDDADPTDLELVAAAHPAIGHTIDRAFVDAQLPLLGAGEFARAFGNARTAADVALIRADQWDPIRHRDAIPDMSVPPVLGVDVALDRSASAVVACWPTPAGVPVVEVVDYRPGVSWAAARVRDLRDQHAAPLLVADAVGPVLTVVDELDRLGVPVTQTGTREFTAACASFLDRVDDGTVWHRGDPVLDAAVAGAGRRTVGDGWGWGRRSSSADVCPLVAATLALWGHARRPAPKRKPVAVT